MIPANTLILGISAVSIILFLFLAFLDRENQIHKIIRAITLIFIVFNLLLIPKATIDAETVCEVVVSNSTQVNDTVTSYSYTDHCYTRSETTNTAFLKSYNWYFKVFVIWMLFYICAFIYLEGKALLDQVIAFWNRRR